MESGSPGEQLGTVATVPGRSNRASRRSAARAVSPAANDASISTRPRRWREAGVAGKRETSSVVGEVGGRRRAASGEGDAGAGLHERRPAASAGPVDAERQVPGTLLRVDEEFTELTMDFLSPRGTQQAIRKRGEERVAEPDTVVSGRRSPPSIAGARSAVGSWPRTDPRSARVR